MTTELDRPWVPHEHPGRAFDELTWLHDCPDCIAALGREAERESRLVLCLKTNGDRVLVTAEYLYEVLAAGHTAESICYLRDDSVREIFVPVNGYLPRTARWWSLSWWEREHLAGRKTKPRTKAVRERAGARKSAAAKSNIVHLDPARARRRAPRRNPPGAAS